jgi:hypothetical protein
MKKPYTKPELRSIDAVPLELSNRRRSQRVALRVSVLVLAEAADGGRIQVQDFTLAVNAHGGLLESPLMAKANQRITLLNPTSGKEVDCRVVRVERSSSEMVTIAFEFHEPTAQFWPITFPPSDWEELAS